MIELYRRILDYLMPLERGILGWGENGFLGNGGNFGLSNMRSGYLNGRFFYTGLGSGQSGGGYVPEKIRGGGFTREVGGVLAVGGLGGVDIARGIGGASAVNGVGGVSGLRDVGGLRGMGGVRGAWNVGNNWIWGMESAALNAVNSASALNAISAANAVNAVNSTSKQNALGYRLGESLEKQLNGWQILGTDSTASIDRSVEITGFFVTEGIRKMLGEQNGFSQNRKTGVVRRIQNAVSENKSLSESWRMQNAVSPKKAASSINGFEENTEEPAAIRGFDENAGRDADTLIDMLCGALREAAFSMSEGVHY